MLILVPNEVIELAKIFKSHKEKLYLVGGYIRNQLLGVSDEENLDIDVCSSCLPEKVIEILKGTSFKTEEKNKELGVIVIENKLRIEHATFRKEKYAFSGVHLPENVEFIKDLNEDCKRRDFRCNAVYYDILGDEIVDPLDGVGDIKKRIVQTTRDADEVFREDPERILRMVRLACSLGFSVEEKTYKASKEYAHRLGNLSSYRKKDEFSQIVLADTYYKFLPNKKYAHARGVGMLADIGALKYVLPALETIRTSNLIEDRGKPLFEHVMNVFTVCAPEVRLSALLHDVGKAKAKMEYGNFNGETEYANNIIEKNLGIDGLGFSKKIVERVKSVVAGINFNKYGLELPRSIRHFIADNHENIELIIALKNAIALDKSNLTKSSFIASRLQKTYNKMKANNVPMTLSDLNLKGNHIIEAFPFIKVTTIGDLLDKLLYKCIDNPALNDKKLLLNEAKKIIEKKKSFYLE